jgi:aminopeptidase N
MMRRTDFHYDGLARGIAGYSKPASLLVALRGLLGEETFLRAYRGYISTWAYHNPKPWDFFNAIEREAGQDLDWFWRSWYYETWLLDQAIASVSSTVGGTRIVVEDRGNVPMPVRLAITLESGEVLRREIAVETWLSGARTAELMIPSGSGVTQVEIDPEQFFPDADRRNNGWRRRT